MLAVQSLVGDTLVYGSKTTINTNSLVAFTDNDVETCKRRVIGLYFSARWCPPCRDFTPLLVKFYQRFKASNVGMESCLVDIIFVSSDHDESSFYEYLKDMPWPAVPFVARSCKVKLSRKFQVQGIPCLVLIDADSGAVITNYGRQAVIDDPEGRDFPWFPDTLSSLLYEGTLLRGSEVVNSRDTLQDKIKGIFFSANWCPPCRTFTPDLINVYHVLTEAGHNFEVVYVGSDRSAESFSECYGTMPWLSIPFGDDRISKLTKHFNVKGIPTLVLLDANDAIISKDGRAVISRDHDGKEFPWPSVAFEELSEVNANVLNESACLLLLTDSNPELMKKSVDLLTCTAAQYHTQWKSSLQLENPAPQLHFFYEGPRSADIVERLLLYVSGGIETSDAAEDDPARVRAVLLDMQERRLLCVMWKSGCEDPLSTRCLQNLLDDFQHDRLQLRSFEI